MCNGSSWKVYKAVLWSPSGLFVNACNRDFNGPFIKLMYAIHIGPAIVEAFAVACKAVLGMAIEKVSDELSTSLVMRMRLGSTGRLYSPTGVLNAKLSNRIRSLRTSPSRTIPGSLAILKEERSVLVMVTFIQKSGRPYKYSDASHTLNPPKLPKDQVAPAKYVV
ncbi:hypothetical protein LTR49_028183 [Elasticomyces elasticus]|nr:hypothetical protein LTR49_028183 [Elasticomyces elasticus]